jgi:hypothetical protein
MARAAVPKGVRLIVDDKGKKLGVVLDLKDDAELWEGVYDRAVARRRAREPRVSLQAVKARLRGLGKLPK